MAIVISNQRKPSGESLRRLILIAPRSVEVGRHQEAGDMRHIHTENLGSEQDKWCAHVFEYDRDAPWVISNRPAFMLTHYNWQQLAESLEAVLKFHGVPFEKQQTNKLAKKIW